MPHADPLGKSHVLTFVTVPGRGTGTVTRADDAPPDEMDVAIDGIPFPQLVTGPDVSKVSDPPLDFDYSSVATPAWPDASASDLRRLAGELPPDDGVWPLEVGRLPLYICTFCGDLGCGAITVAVDHGPDQTIWSDVRTENGYSDGSGLPDLSGLGPFTFDSEPYRRTLLAQVDLIDTLHATETGAGP